MFVSLGNLYVPAWLKLSHHKWNVDGSRTVKHGGNLVNIPMVNDLFPNMTFVENDVMQKEICRELHCWSSTSRIELLTYIHILVLFYAQGCRASNGQIHLYLMQNTASKPNWYERELAWPSRTYSIWHVLGKPVALLKLVVIAYASMVHFLGGSWNLISSMMTDATGMIGRNRKRKDVNLPSGKSEHILYLKKKNMLFENSVNTHQIIFKI